MRHRRLSTTVHRVRSPRSRCGTASSRPAEVFDLVDPISVGNVGEWHMDEIGPGPAFDASGMARDLNFYGGAEIPASGAGQSGTGLRLDGVDDYVTPDVPVLLTNQSLTHLGLGEARPRSPTATRSVAQPRARSSTFLRGLEGKCGHDRPGPPTGPGATSTPGEVQYGRGHRCVGASGRGLRRSTGQIRLYVNGRLIQTTTRLANACDRSRSSETR